MNTSDAYYFEPVLRYVQSIQGTRNVVLVGHSLGGGVAKIVGAKTGIPALSLSGPGLKFTSYKYGITLDGT